MKINKIIEYVFYLFILILPLQSGVIIREIFVKGVKMEYGTIIFYLSDLLLLLLFGLFICNWFNENKKIIIKNRPFLFKIIILFIFWSFISIFWSQDKELAAYFFIKILSAIALFFIILNLKINLKKVFIVILVSVLLYCGLGLLHFFSQETFSNTLLGLSKYSVDSPGVSIVDTPEKRWLRSYSVFPHPNIFGGYVVVVLFFIIGLFLNKKYFFKNSILIIIPLIVLFLSLITSFSRSAWLSFVLGCVFIFIFNLYKEKNKNNSRLIRVFLLFLSIFIVFYIIFSNTIHSRIFINNEKEERSITQRIEHTTEASGIIKKHPIQGVGLGNYVTSIYTSDNKKQYGWYYQPVHNVYILIFTELGLIGGLLFLNIIIYCFYIFIKNIKNIKNIMPFIVFLSILIIMLFDHYFWTTHFGLILFWVSLAGIVKVFQDNNFMVK